MSHQIIRQPDGLLAVFSTVVDAWIVIDSTPEELADWYAKEAADEARARCERLVEAVIEGRARDVYHQFVMTFEEADALSAEHYGDMERIRLEILEEAEADS